MRTNNTLATFLATLIAVHGIAAAPAPSPHGLEGGGGGHKVLARSPLDTPAALRPRKGGKDPAGPKPVQVRPDYDARPPSPILSEPPSPVRPPLRRPLPAQRPPPDAPLPMAPGELPDLSVEGTPAHDEPARPDTPEGARLQPTGRSVAF